MPKTKTPKKDKPANDPAFDMSAPDRERITNAAHALAALDKAITAQDTQGVRAVYADLQRLAREMPRVVYAARRVIAPPPIVEAAIRADVAESEVTHAKADEAADEDAADA